jgi:hypothetical protein
MTTPAQRETHGAGVVGVLCVNNPNLRPVPFEFNERYEHDLENEIQRQRAAARSSD